MAKVRCLNCRAYVEKSDAVWAGPLRKFCSADCQRLYSTKKIRKPQKRMRSTRHVINTKLRQRILDRDQYRCRYCGTRDNLHLHHCVYLSGGGADEESNILALCLEHHALIHSDKKRYQHLCLGVIWLTYCGQRLTVPQLEGRLHAE